MGSGQLISGKNNGSRFLGNVWWSSEAMVKFMEYSSLFAWAKATGQETLNGRILGLQTDPLFYGPLLTGITDPYMLNQLEGYILKPDSPLKDLGVEIKTTFGFGPPSVDFFGNPVPHGSAPEPGIYELQ